MVLRKFRDLGRKLTAANLFHESTPSSIDDAKNSKNKKKCVQLASLQYDVRLDMSCFDFVVNRIACASDRCAADLSDALCVCGILALVVALVMHV